jgi:hypothetical protein
VALPGEFRLALVEPAYEGRVDRVDQQDARHRTYRAQVWQGADCDRQAS